MKYWRCYNCGSERFFERPLVMKICPCTYQMELKEVNEEDGKRKL